MRQRLLIGSLVSASATALAASTVVNLNAFVHMRGTAWESTYSIAGSTNPRVMAVEYLIIGGAPVLAWLAAGCALATLRRGNALSWWFLAYGLMLSCVALFDAVSRSRVTMTAGDGGTAVNALLYVLFLILHPVVLLIVPTVALVSYPDGRLPARWWRWPAGVVVASIALHYALKSLPGENAEQAPALGVISLLLGYLPAAATIVVAILVCRRHALYPQRQQLAWFAGCALLAFACRYLLTSAGWYPGSGPVLLWALTDPMLIIPIGIAAGVLRHRLLGIPAALRRALVYAALTALLYNVYLPVAWGAGLSLDRHPLLVVVVAGTVVVLVRARDRLRRAAARFVYGARRNPLQALAELSDSLAENNHLDLVPAAVATVAAAVGADGAVLVAPDGKVLARAGQEPSRYLALSLRFGGAEIGELRVAGPPGGELYSEVEVRLLTALATQLAVVVSAAELTEALEAERNRVVTATRDERDRLRRDLHDGLGPSLAGLSLGLQALAGQVDDPDTPAGALVQRLRSGTDTAVRDIRRIIDGLRPTVLDTANLAQAVERHATSLGPALPVDVTATSLPGLAPDIEAAAYRIITEALTNAARHAHARHAHVTITADEALHIAVSDDGCGIPANTAATGVGLSSMRRRAETLGGDLTIDSTDDGTTITATLPLSSARCH
ncbi:ATP-binding protein [Actinoplanes sp. ATCC 53533]|uniref:sensor histidine kinase n=1 Tax=Actinoplanes sp. ATCC 53533 TaxID=1288362 RepID=UPI001315062E|nr:ATP-binding protein [Actinoplanes sp. ATCC 53533]